MMTAQRNPLPSRGALALLIAAAMAAPAGAGQVYLRADDDAETRIRLDLVDRRGTPILAASTSDGTPVAVRSDRTLAAGADPVLVDLPPNATLARPDASSTYYQAQVTASGVTTRWLFQVPVGAGPWEIPALAELAGIPAADIPPGSALVDRLPPDPTDADDGRALTTLDGAYILTDAPAGSGTVTSVAATGAGGITVSGSPITAAGTLALDIDETTLATGLGLGTAAYTATSAYDAAGTGAGLLAGHVAAADPHPGYRLESAAVPYADLSGAPTTWAWSAITATPTTLAGYGITDAATSSQGSLADSAVQPGDDAADLGSASASDSYVLTADGAGGAAWEAVSGTGGHDPVTMAGTLDYLTLSGQQITRGAIDLATDVTGALPYASLSGAPTTWAWSAITTTPTTLAGYGITDAATSSQGSLADSAVQPGDDAADLGSGSAADSYVLTADGAGGAAWEAVSGTGGHDPVTMAGTLDYLTLSGQQITRGAIDLATDVTGALPYASLSGAPTAWAWSAITTTPTTLAGYGITDAVPSTRTITAGTGLSGGGALSADRTLALADTAVTPGSYGSGTAAVVLTVDAQGRLTAASTAAITAAGIGAEPAGVAAADITDSTSAGRGLLTAADAAAQRTALGLATVPETITLALTTPGDAITADTTAWAIPWAATLTGASIQCRTAPVSLPTVVDLRYSSTAGGTASTALSAAMSVGTGQTSATGTLTTTSVAAGGRLDLVVTQADTCADAYAIVRATRTP